MKTPKRPRDPAQLAKLIVDIATGEVEELKAAKVEERPAPQSLGGWGKSHPTNSETENRDSQSRCVCKVEVPQDKSDT